MNPFIFVIMLGGVLLYYFILSFCLSRWYAQRLCKRSTDKLKKVQISAKSIQKTVAIGGVVLALLTVAQIFTPLPNKNFIIAFSVLGLIACVGCGYTFKRVETIASKELNNRNVKEEE